MIWKHFETYREILKQFETDNLKSIETYGEIWKPLKPMGKNWKHFERHYFENYWNLWGNLKALWKTLFWKPLKPMGKFENTLKQIIWKPLKPMGYFETHNFKTIETYGEIWKHFQTHNFENT